MQMIVISMDSHTELVADLKPFMPRKLHAEFDEGGVLARRYFGKIIDAFSSLTNDPRNLGEVGFTPVPDSGRRGGLEEYVRPLPIKERLALIDADGVAAEFITPFIGAFSHSVDFLHECTLAYHRYFEDYVSAAPFRFTGSTVANLICGMETVLEEIDDAYKHGLRAISLPGKVSFVSRELPTYNSRYYDPMWAALAERKMAAIFHAGYGREKPLLRWDGTIWPWSASGKAEPGWELLVQHNILVGEREYLLHLMAGAVPERFPDLRIGILESGTQWIAPVLREIDMWWRSQTKAGSLQSYRGEMSPIEQWHRQCFVTSFFAEDEVELRHTLGIRNMMWGSDFPHVEGTYPKSREHLGRLFAAVPSQEVEAIVGKNAAAMMNFDLEKLAQTAAAKIPWPH
jgi:predicted TIM-barrel fold metal-dependent hydrolase